MKRSFFAFVILAGLAAAIAVQHQTYSRHLEENLALREQAAQLEELRAANKGPAKAEPPPIATGAPAEDQSQQLQRLRAEVGSLKKQLTESTDAGNALRAARQQIQAANAAQMEAFKQSFESKKELLENWVPAFMNYVEKNPGPFPASFEQVRASLPAELQAGTDLMTQNFDITFQGSLTNLSNPRDVIVMRQKEPMQSPGKGTWLRAYVFADGHSDIHSSPDGNFAAWEQEHSAQGTGQ